MSLKKEIEGLKNLEALKITVRALGIDNWAKEKIIDTIELETDFIRRKIFNELGQAEYNKLIGEK